MGGTDLLATIKINKWQVENRLVFTRLRCMNTKAGIDAQKIWTRSMHRIGLGVYSQTYKSTAQQVRGWEI